MSSVAVDSLCSCLKYGNFFFFILINILLWNVFEKQGQIWIYVCEKYVNFSFTEGKKWIYV